MYLWSGIIAALTYFVMSEAKILRILEKHGATLEKHGKDIAYLKENMATKKDLLRIDSQFDFFAKKFLEHDERLDRIEENMATKKDVNKIMNTLDRFVALYEKKDQEQTIALHDAARLEDRVVILEKDMMQIKPALGLA